MYKLPITRITLYKHGVGFYERRADIDDKEIELTFRASEMDDILKSLTIIDWGKGKVLGLEYPTPLSQSEKLVSCSIHLDKKHSLRDLLISLRGRRVRLFFGEIIRVANYPAQAKSLVGTLIGLDETDGQETIKKTIITLLRDDNPQIFTIELGELGGVEILDERCSDDLRFYLKTISKSDENCQVKVRLTPGSHNLSVSYVAPAPAWRVSYRMVSEKGIKDGQPRVMLLGLGIIDNSLEEDLDNVSLNLIAGMPVSFIYDLYKPFIPKRPTIEEETRTLPVPGEYEQNILLKQEASAVNMLMEREPAHRDIYDLRKKFNASDLENSLIVNTHGEIISEMCQYTIETPVTVGRGQSAIVPILSASLGYRKDLIYNKTQSPVHPVATLRLKNQTGFSLERGPVTVVEDGKYIGEGILPFTPIKAEIIVPYAIELGIKIRQQKDQRTELRGIGIKDMNLLFVEWDVQVNEYHLTNNTAEPKIVLIEHPLTPSYELYDSPKPKERTAQHYRFEIQIPAHNERTLKVQERRLCSRQEELRRQSYSGLQQYLKDELIDQKTNDQVVTLLNLWEKVNEKEKQIQEIKGEQEAIYKSQDQFQKNMQALSDNGKEGSLRESYIEKLRISEINLEGLLLQEAEFKQDIHSLEHEVSNHLNALNNSNP